MMGEPYLNDVPNKDDSRKSNSFPARIVVCMLATKGGVTMYDYMKALQERFDEKQLEHLVYAVQSAREVCAMA